LSGLQADRDIEIRFTGVRPGERLYEEMLLPAESVLPTSHPKILRVRNGEPLADMVHALDQLILAAQAGQPDTTLRMLLKGLVPGFASQDREAATVQPRRVDLPATPIHPALFPTLLSKEAPAAAG
jgi:FlaA1/EpsC-like NDP-sugar epimerase